MINKLFNLIDQERSRQEHTINLIASENYASNAVLQITGSVLTNKYAEGYPGKRYYGGCSIIDTIEQEAIDLAKQLFKAEHVNVQSHSGASANFSVYLGLLQPGDTILGMSLSSGGHLTHGHGVNFSGIFYKIIPYNVDPVTELIDYDVVHALAVLHKPKLIIAGASAYSRLIDYQRFAAIAQEVGAKLLVDMAHIAGLVATGVVESPIPFADVVTTTTHKTLRGPRGAMILSRADIAQRIDKAVMPGSQGGPLMHVIAAKAMAFAEAMQPSFFSYAQNVITNAQAMVSVFRELGYRIVAGGTDTHLFMIDVRTAPSTHGLLSGYEVEQLLESCNITINRNAIPYDPQPPTRTSGIRIGTPAITTRGATIDDVQQIVVWIHDILRCRDNQSMLVEIKKKIDVWCENHPINIQLQTIQSLAVNNLNMIR